MKLIKCLGYTVVNINTKKFPDYNGYESENDFESWEDTNGPKELIEEVKSCALNHNTKHSRLLKNKVKYYKIVKLSLYYKT